MKAELVLDAATPSAKARSGRHRSRRCTGSRWLRARPEHATRGDNTVRGLRHRRGFGRHGDAHHLALLRRADRGAAAGNPMCPRSRYGCHPSFSASEGIKFMETEMTATLASPALPDLGGRVALVTGASTGIARRSPGPSGPRHESRGPLQPVARAPQLKSPRPIRSAGGEALLVKADVRDSAEIRQAVAEVLKLSAVSTSWSTTRAAWSSGFPWRISPTNFSTRSCTSTLAPCWPSAARWCRP